MIVRELAEILESFSDSILPVVVNYGKNEMANGREACRVEFLDVVQVDYGEGEVFFMDDFWAGEELPAWKKRVRILNITTS